MTPLGTPEPQTAPAWVRRDAKPFEPGNKAAVVHGGASVALVSEDAEQVVAEMMEMAPHLCELDRDMVRLFAMEKARYNRYYNFESQVLAGERDVNGKSGPEAVPRNVIDALRGCANTIKDIARSLALTPVDRAALMKDASWARILSKGGDPVISLAGRGHGLRRLGPGSSEI